jgi:molybdopterin-guanine dinucleotide biosynthesis protein A
MIAALILAGGRGTRLAGADKALIPLAGEPLLTHLLTRLTPQIQTIAISANGNLARFAPYNFPILPDSPAHTGKGPLAGIAAGLAWAQSIGATSLLTIPVDTPFIPADLAARLTPAPAVAVWQSRQHHLVAHWPTAFLPALTDFLSTPSAYKVRDALTRAAAAQIHFTNAEDPFLNINTPNDLVEAEKRFFFEKKNQKTFAP